MNPTPRKSVKADYLHNFNTDITNNHHFTNQLTTIPNIKKITLNPWYYSQGGCKLIVAEIQNNKKFESTVGIWITNIWITEWTFTYPVFRCPLLKWWFGIQMAIKYRTIPRSDNFGPFEYQISLVLASWFPQITGRRHKCIFRDDGHITLVFRSPLCLFHLKYLTHYSAIYPTPLQYS